MTEIRNPKEIRRPKSEWSSRKPAVCSGFGFRISFGFRPSDFGILSDFGPRISDFFRLSALGFRILLAPLLITAGHAQSPLSNLVFAVGTTWRDNASQDWSYVLLDNPDDRVLAGRRLAVFGKPGHAGS